MENFGKLKTSLYVTLFRYKFSMKIIFYLPVNTDKPKFLAFLIFVCTIALFIAQISSSESVSKWDFIMAPVAKQ